MAASGPHPAEHAGRPVLAARTRDELAAWLAAHGSDSEAVWLRVWKRSAPDGSLRYVEAVEELLCHGWIDATANRLDGHSYLQLISPRRPGSIWSPINKERVERLVAEGRMRPAGLAVVERARADGSWSQFDSVHALEEPDDLRRRLDADPALRAAWDASAPSRRKLVLGALVQARTDATRRRRIDAALGSLAEGPLRS